jgi:hypothetical protein
MGAVRVGRRPGLSSRWAASRGLITSSRITIRAAFQNCQQSLQRSEPDSGSPFPTNKRNDLTFDIVAQVQFSKLISPSMVNSATLAMKRCTVNHVVDGFPDVDQVPGFSETLPFDGFLSNRIPLVDG